MRRTSYMSIAVLLILSAMAQAKDISADLAAWQIHLTGSRSETVTVAQLTGLMAQEGYSATFDMVKRGNSHSFRGIPLYKLVSLVDNAEGKDQFDKERWEHGYEVSVTAADGYTATFDTIDVPYDAPIVALLDNDVPVAPRIVGDTGRGLWVKEIVDITLSFPAKATGAGNDNTGYRLVVDTNGTEHDLTIADLEASPLYIEGNGSYTTTAGTTYTSRWGGVRFAALLSSFSLLKEEDRVTVVSLDGYRKSFPARDIMNTENGTWILALKQDGASLSEELGPVRTIKIGPDVPDIPGSSSVRMIGRIEVSSAQEGDSEVHADSKGS